MSSILSVLDIYVSLKSFLLAIFLIFCRNLQELYTSGNRISELSFVPDFFPRLEILNISCNNIKTLDEVVSRIFVYSLIHWVTIIDFNSHQLSLLHQPKAMIRSFVQRRSGSLLLVNQKATQNPYYVSFNNVPLKS